MAVCRVTYATELATWVLHDGALALGGYIHFHEAVLAVSIKDFLAVRAPHQLTDVGVVILGELDRFTVFALQPNFSFAGAVADVSNVLAVRAELGTTFIGSRCTGDVTGYTLCSRHIEYLATGSDCQTLAVARKAGSGNLVRYILHFCTSVHVFATEGNRNLGRLTSLRVELIQVTCIFVHDDVTVRTWELDIVFSVVGHLFSLLGFCVVNEKVHGHIAVADEEDFIANPHRDDVLRYIVGDVFHLLGSWIVYPNIIGHTAFVILPSTEFTHHTVVSQFLSVRRITTETTFWQWQYFRHTTFLADCPKFTCKTIVDTVTVYDTLAVLCPSHDDVVRAHAVAQIVTAIGRCISESLRLSAVLRHEEYFGIAVVLSGEGDVLTVRREACKHFVSDV